MREVNGYERPDNGRVNLAHHLDLLIGSDHSAAFKTLLTTKGAGYDYYLPDGATLKLPLGLTTAAGGTGVPDLPTKARLVGGGKNAVVQVTGWEGANKNSGNYAALQINGDSKDDVVVANVCFTGDWTTGLGTWTNGQAAVIFVKPTTNNSGNRRNRFEHLIFRDHYGFPIHDEGNGYLMVVDCCEFYNCGNGLNVNGDLLTVTRCYFENSEGVETSSAGGVFTHNVFVNALHQAFALGGKVGSSPVYPALLCAHNLIFGTDDASTAGQGIVTAESFTDGVIAHNYIERTKAHGIQLATGASTSAGNDGISVLHNHVVSCGLLTNTNRIGIVVATDKAQVIGNRVLNRTGTAAGGADYDLYGCTSGIQVSGADCVLDGNDLTGVNYALDLTGALRVVWGPSNRLTAGATGTMNFRNGATFADASLLGRAQTAVGGGGSTYAPTYFERDLSVTAASAAKTVNLLTAVGVPGKRYRIWKTDAGANTVTVDPNGSETINGASTKVISSQYGFVEIVSDNANWLMTASLGTVT